MRQRKQRLSTEPVTAKIEKLRKINSKFIENTVFMFFIVLVK